MVRHRTEDASTDETERAALGSGRIPRREFAKRAAITGLGVSGLSSLLAACGGSSSGSSGGSGTAASTAIPAKATGSIDVLSWDYANPEAPATVALKARRLAWLKANPGASLMFEPAPFDSYTAVVTTRSRAGKLSDVLEILAEEAQSALFPALKPLTRQMFPDLADTLSLWDSTTMSAQRPGDHAGVPIGATGGVWYYNKAMLQKAGLPAEVAPTTWAELTDIVAKLKAAGMTPVAFAGDAIATSNMWSAHAVQFLPTTTDLNDFREGRIAIDDARFADSLQPLVQAAKDGWWNGDFVGKTLQDMEAEFAQGRAAMVCGLVGGAANWPVWDRRLGKDGYGLFAAPTMPKATRQIFWWAPDIMYGINKDAANLPAALSFVDFLASKEGQTIGLALGGALPNRTDVDVAAVTRSKGAVEIGRLAQQLPTVDTALAYLKPAATTAMFSTLGATIKSGDVSGFLSTLAQQNKA